MHHNVLVQSIKDRRESLQVTQETLSELSDVSLRTIKQFERGKGNPTLNTLEKLADTLGLELCFQLKDLSKDKIQSR